MEKRTYIFKKEDENLYIKEILKNKLRFSSRLVKKLKFSETPLVFVDGQPVRLWYKGKAGQTLEINYPEETSGFEPQDIGLDVVYEDDDLLVVNKAAGTITHPTTNFQDYTLANGIVFHMRQTGENYKPHFVNRLDMNTSGLVIVGKNGHAQNFLNGEMLANRVVKNYVAIVEGRVTEGGTVDAPIAKDENHAARRIVTPEGQRSITHYEVLETAGDYSLLKLRLETGRTHQIRCHMRYIGHPIVGDEIYEAKSYPDIMTRQALHACHIEFTQPVTGKLISCDAPVPLDMQECLKTLGFCSKI